MNKSVLSVSIILAGMLLGFLHYRLKPRPDEKLLQQYSAGVANSARLRGRIAPEFTLKTTNGESFQLADNIGKKVIVLNFFATWCGPCRAEMPELERYYSEHRNDFVLVGIDAEETPERVENFLHEVKVDFPVGIDAGSIRKHYRVESFPTTVVIGIDGKVQSYESGAIENADVAFTDLLAKNLQLHAIELAEYRKQAQAQEAILAAEKKDSDDDVKYKLDARGTRIAARMGCPCGCDDRVSKCSCGTAKHIKKALAEEDFKDQSDDAIIRGLNKRFCSGDM